MKDTKEPNRISDIIKLKKKGDNVICKTSFDINEISFRQHENFYEAYLFICTYSGTINDEPFSFRKCYSKGCPNNLCPHVYQAVMIANRFLIKDYFALKNAGIEIEKKMFTIEEMLVKFHNIDVEKAHLMMLDDFINLAKEGHEISVYLTLEQFAAVEHFQNNKEAKMYLNATFNVDYLGQTHSCQRCLNCYTISKENEEKETSISIANDCLKEMFDELESVNIKVQKKFF